MSAKVKSLISAAQEVFETPAEPDRVLDRIDAYVTAFARLDLSDLSEEEAEVDLLKELAELHARVLEYAEDLRLDAKDELRVLRAKGKGVLAYLESASSPQRARRRKKL